MIDNKPIVSLTPMPDNYLTATEAYVLPLQEASYSIVVTTDTDMIAATDLQAKIRKAIHVIEGERKTYTGPLDTKKREIKGAFDQLIDPLRSSDKFIDSKVSEFRARQRQEREAALKQMEEAGNNNNERELTDRAPTPPLPPPPVDRTDNVVFVKTREWIVVDFQSVPDEYKSINNGAVTKAISDGVVIPGIEVYEKESIRRRG